MRWVTDRLGRLVWVSSEWEEFAGVSLHDIEGSRGDAVIRRADRGRILCAGALAVAQLREFDCTFHHTAHGLWLPVVTHCRPALENGIWRGYHGWTERIQPSKPLISLAETRVQKKSEIILASSVIRG